MQAQSASFWRRGAGFLVDLAIVGVGGYLAGFTLERAWEATFSTDWQSLQKLQILIFFVLLGLTWLYFALFESGEKQATPGKQLFGLRVVRSDGENQDEAVGFWRASARFAVKLVGALLFGITFWVALFRRSKRSLHDIASATRVIHI